MSSRFTRSFGFDSLQTVDETLGAPSGDPMNVTGTVWITGPPLTLTGLFEKKYNRCAKHKNSTGKSQNKFDKSHNGKKRLFLFKLLAETTAAFSSLRLGQNVRKWSHRWYHMIASWKLISFTLRTALPVWNFCNPTLGYHSCPLRLDVCRTEAFPQLVFKI